MRAPEDKDPTLAMRLNHAGETAVLALTFTLLGPLLLAGELVGPFGNVHWKQLLMGVVGTWLWIGVVWIGIL